jgi:hypothetical protein
MAQADSGLEEASEKESSIKVCYGASFTIV